MNMTVPIALFGWIPAILLIFMRLPSRRAMIVCFLLGWMFLPTTGYTISGFPDFTKVTATSFGVSLATMVFAPDRLRSLRWRWLDAPMVAWCVCPFASSLSNGLGAYDGLSAVVDHVVTWGLPYVLGRAYIRTLDDLREIAVFLLVGGLIYVPFCIWEIRMSPQLHQFVYGFGGRGIEYADELGKWGSRPRVFMGTALTVGVFMTAASLVGIWLWTTGSLTRLRGLPAAPLILLLLVTTVLCKNLGGLALLVFGLSAFIEVRVFRTAVLVHLLILAIPLYMVARSTGIWSATPLVKAAALIHERRAGSVKCRLDNEDGLIAKALERPVCGWGRWGRARVYDEEGRDTSLTDGLWVITMGNTGLTGLAALTSMLLLPTAVFLRRYPARLWIHPAFVPATALALLAILYMIDNLFNAMLNPIYVVAIGGLSAWLPPRGRLCRPSIPALRSDARRNGQLVH